nr:PttA2 protein [Ipomoea batatas]
MKMIHPNGYTWKNVSNEYKDLYFVEFKKFYKWDESIEAQVRKAFLAQGDLCYADMLSKFKAKQTSTRRPACAIWEAYWGKPDVKAKSELQRKNRMSGVEGPGTGCSRHTEGSRSAIEHYHKLEEVQARHDAATQEAEDSTKSPNINMPQLSPSSTPVIDLSTENPVVDDVIPLDESVPATAEVSNGLHASGSEIAFVGELRTDTEERWIAGALEKTDSRF